jgi:predicted ribosomally synthesized peptide with SipW-like signal peptide
VKNMKKKTILTLALMALVMIAAVSGTMAYLKSTETVTNTFVQANVKCTVVEPDWQDGNTVKSNVTIRNDGSISAYIRAAIVVTWKDSNGNTMAEKPGAGDYTLSIGSDWTANGGYYYYNQTVATGASTTNLINQCVSSGTYTDGRTLCVEVLGSAIQADGMGASSAQDAFAKAQGN